jgi:hypothetical protein
LPAARCWCSLLCLWLLLLLWLLLVGLGLTVKMCMAALEGRNGGHGAHSGGGHA